MMKAHIKRFTVTLQTHVMSLASIVLWWNSTTAQGCKPFTLVEGYI